MEETWKVQFISLLFQIYLPFKVEKHFIVFYRCVLITHATRTILHTTRNHCLRLLVSLEVLEPNVKSKFLYQMRLTKVANQL